MMTSDAKTKLSRTIRALRERLLTELNEAVDREYKFTLKNPKLDTKTRVRRQRLEDWLEEQVRTQSGKVKRTKDDFRRDAEKQAAYTLLNRLVILRIMEAVGLRKPKVATGGWNSQGYKDFRELAQALVHSDGGEGYPFLLQLIFEDLAIDLPGLYGSAGVADLIPVPSPTIRAVVEAFDDEDLQSCWTDDMTLGWVYQYWNDPEREALDAKINDGGKIEPHEIASKTQMFTERYMVDWLLQNSLGPMWLAMCQKHGWTPDVIADGTLDRLEQRRTEWRAKRDERQAIVAFRSAKVASTDANFAERNATLNESQLPGVSLTDLMPLETDAERRWAYYVPQPIPDDAVQHAPNSVRDLKILDPAVGSGHFLVVAFDLLFALYKEEAKHLGECAESPFAPRKDAPVSQNETQLWTDQSIIERILEHNLHGIDLDPRAVQIAAAALWLKAQNVALRSAKEAGVAFAERKPTLKQLNLVASNLGISRLPDNDPSLVELRRVIEAETGIPGKLTMQIVESLKGADHLGSLLRIDQAIEAAIVAYEEEIGWKNKVVQINLFPDGTKETKPRPISREWATTGVLSALENFLSRHTSSEELGLRLAGEQLAAGVRFVRLVKEGTYDLVVANPPYQGTSKMADAKYVSTHYKLAKADLFAAFLLRGLQLVREHGVSAMLTMRNWMFTKQYSDLRQYLLQTYDLRSLGDFDRGAFEDVPDEVVSVCVAVFERAEESRLSLRERNAAFAERKATLNSVALCPTPRDDRTRDSERTQRKRAATLCHVGRHTFDPAALKVVPEWPLVYWWDDKILNSYGDGKYLGTWAPACEGWSGSNNSRPLRFAWEVQRRLIGTNGPWVPYIGGADGIEWVEPLRNLIDWRAKGLFMKLAEGFYFRNEDKYLSELGVAFTTVGAIFGARLHRYRSVFGSTGRSLFPGDQSTAICCLNATVMRNAIQDLNPTIHFTVGGVNSLPVYIVAGADQIMSRITAAFGIHESHREPSVEFKQPGPSPWRHAQEWAQLAVDRPEGAPLPEYIEELDPEPPTDHLSFAVGLALGRFAANGEGLNSLLSLRESRVPPNTTSISHNTNNPPQDPNFAERNATLPHGVVFLDGGNGEGVDSRLSLRESTIPADTTSVSHDTNLPPQNPNFAERNATLPHGILFLDGALGDDDRRDSLGHPAARIIHDKWSEYGSQIDRKRSLRHWLREKFFPDVHKGMYENRPIHWPLSSAKKTFVAWVTIHRWTDKTLRVLLADHLKPALKRLDGEITDLIKARTEAESASRSPRGFRGAKGDIDDRYADVKAWRDELAEFIRHVQECDERGPEPADPKKPEREVDARYIPDLDDGVMINSAALWPLLDPQWKDPKKWWKELIAAKGKKDYDWSHLAMRYWPTRVDEKCQKDPSLGVAHGCFWKYHPARAWTWELRLQDEIAPNFRIEESRLSLRESSDDFLEGKVTVGSGGAFAERKATIEYRANYLRDNPTAALEAIEKEVLRRKRRQKRPQPELTILEPGLWSAVPDECWELEIRLTDKQQVEFRLLAPDEAESRAKFETAHPDKVKSRGALLSKLHPPDLYADMDEEEFDSESADEDESELSDAVDGDAGS
jgi:hypothetical protein